MFKSLTTTGRIFFLAIGAVVLLALALVALPRFGGGDTQEIIVVHAQSVAPAPVVTAQPHIGPCGAGAYVSGDLVGDASPAAVYTAMCGGH